MNPRFARQRAAQPFGAAFRQAGVDYRQWRALARAHALVSLSALRGVYGRTEAVRAALALLGNAVGLTFMGVMPALAIWLVRDTLVGATLLTTVVAGLVATTVLYQNPSMITPGDFEIVGFRPVSSSTYFAARATGVLGQTLWAAAGSGWLSIIAFLTRPGGSWLLALSAAAAVLASALSMTFGLLATYGWLLRIIRPARVARVVAFLQAALPLAMALSLIAPLLFIGLGVDAEARDFVLPATMRTFWYPGAWFAAYVEIARGTANRLETVAAACSGLLLVIFAGTLRSRLSSDYAVRLAQQATDESPARKPAYAWPFLRGETRATALLLIAQLRGDANLQSRLLLDAGMFVLVLLALGATSGLPPDPFITAAPPDKPFPIAAFAAAMIVVAVYRTLTISDSAEAGWLFFGTPADRGKIVVAAADFAALLALLPMVIVVASVCSYSFGNIVHAVLFALVVGLIGYAALQVGVLAGPNLPCSRPLMPGQSSFRRTNAWLLLLGPMLVSVATYRVFTSTLAKTPARLSVGVACMLALVAGLRWLARTRAIRRLRHSPI